MIQDAIRNYIDSEVLMQGKVLLIQEEIFVRNQLRTKCEAFHQQVDYHAQQNSNKHHLDTV